MSSYEQPVRDAADARPGPGARDGRPRTAPRAPSRGTNWIIFSAVILVTAGLLNVVDGLWALDASNSATVTDEVEELLWYSDSLELWGWIYTILGAVLILVGFGLLRRNQLARWIGVGAAAVSMTVNMMWVFAYPVPALIHFLLATTVLYALVVYGGDDFDRPADPRSATSELDRITLA
jgi:hypothetical protein